MLHLFSTGNLGTCTKDVELFVKKEGVKGRAIWVLECHDEGGVGVSCKSGGWVNPARFLSNFESSIGGIMDNE